MVAKIVTGKSIRGILHYNEHKVEANQASLIMASGFAAEIDRMNLDQKLNRFRHLTYLTPRVKTNAMHISLNFHARDILSDEKLQQISQDYMSRIGFSEQPFLVYRHQDSAHPHVHIVSTNIRRDGSRMDLHNIGKTLSEPARKAIEQQYGLTVAQGQEKILRSKLERVCYGQQPSKKVINNTLTRVSQEYAFGSFAEFKTILEYFGIHTDRGAEGTKMFEKKGLQYCCLDDHGKPKGVPIKASALSGKPTMANLEKRYAKNLERKKELKLAVKDLLDKVLSGDKELNETRFSRLLLAQDVVAIFRKSDNGLLYGISYIDLSQKVIFNGSELGKAYSAKAVESRLSPIPNQKEWSMITSNKLIQKSDFNLAMHPINFDASPILETLTVSGETAPIGLPKRKKKRRKGKKINREIQNSR